VKNRRKRERDIEADCSPGQSVSKLRRLADCIEQGRPFRLQVAGERISIPRDAVMNIEHERGASDEEIEFQLEWSVPAKRGRER